MGLIRTPPRLEYNTRLQRVTHAYIGAEAPNRQASTVHPTYLECLGCQNMTLAHY